MVKNAMKQFSPLSSLFIVLLFCHTKASDITPNTYGFCNVQNLKESSASEACGAYNATCEEQGIPAKQTCIKHDNLTRCWYTFIPNNAKSSTDPVPLVFDLHGYTGCGAMNPYYTGWYELAKDNGFVMIWPQGNMDASITNTTCWDAGGCCCHTGTMLGGEPVDIDDIGFLRQIASNIAMDEEVKINTKRIYFAGHSNGCMMSQAMAANASDLVAAVCCHAGMLVTDPAADYSPTSIFVVHGNLDFVLPFDVSNINPTNYFFPTALKNIDRWGLINGCTENTTEISSNNLYARHIYSNCSDETKVELLELFDVGHSPYLGFEPFWLDPPEAKVPTVDTTLLAWEFCSQFETNDTPLLEEPAKIVPPDTFTLLSESREGGFSSTSDSSSEYSVNLLLVCMIMTVTMIMSNPFSFKEC